MSAQSSGEGTNIIALMGGFTEPTAVNAVYKNNFIGVYIVNKEFLNVAEIKGLISFVKYFIIMFEYRF